MPHNKKTKWTLAAVVDRNRQMGGHFFSPDTMRFFGDAMSYFRVKTIAGRVFLERIHEPRQPPPGTFPVGQLREFFPETGMFGNNLTDAEVAALKESANA